MKNLFKAFKILIATALFALVITSLTSCGVGLISLLLEQSEQENVRDTEQRVETNVPQGDKAPENSENTAMPHSHSWSAWKLISAPSCSQEGEERRTCGCGEKEFRAVDALPHTEIVDAGVAPTCTEDGLTDGIHCEVCKEVLVEQTKMEALGHKEVIDEAVAPTCSQPGLTEGSHCLNCDTPLKKQETIPQKEHIEVVDAGVAPTCTENGLTDGIHCEVCNEVIKEQVTVPSTGHSPTVKYEEPTWDKKGTKGVGCLNCDYYEFEYTDAAYSESLYGYGQFAYEEKGEQLRALYYKIYTACEKIHSSKTNYTEINNFADIDASDLDLTTNEAIAVWKIFYVENPKYYWMSNSIGYAPGALRIYVDSLYFSFSVRVQCNADIENMITECQAVIFDADTDLKKVRAIHDYIAGKIEYAYIPNTQTPETAQWAHNIIGVASKDKGVCESYAKTFLFLCRIYGIDCIIVTGVSYGEGHAWNVVEINGNWYYVDLTWNDSTKSYYYFGLSEEEFSETHTKDGSIYGIDYMYELPEISDM